MAFEANVYQVMIASPSDVSLERNIARQIVHNWNAVNAFDKGLVLQPVDWETNSAPKMGMRPQEIINKQILESSDLLIGIFWTRLGTPTGEAISGTVEEIEKHIDAGKAAMLYFSNTPVVLDSIDLDQYKALKKFKEECFHRGLVETYDSIEAFQDKLTRQLGIIINTEDHFKKKQTILTTEMMVEAKQQFDNEFAIVNELTEESKELIRQTSQDPSGEVMKLHYMDGFDIQTNGNKLNKDHSPRTRAAWDAAFEQLIINDLLDERGTQGQIFSLTMEGYKIADYLLTQ